MVAAFSPFDTMAFSLVNKFYLGYTLKEKNMDVKLYKREGKYFNQEKKKDIPYESFLKNL